MDISDLPYETALPARFWDKVDENGPIPAHAPELGNCWVWTACRVPKGYGSITMPRKSGDGWSPAVSHRLAYEDALGVIPGGLVVDHMCYNRACQRPSHMRVATNVANCQNRSGQYSGASVGIRGVTKSSSGSTFRARGTLNGKEVHIGTFRTAEEAGEAASNWRRENYPDSYMDHLKEAA